MDRAVQHLRAHGNHVLDDLLAHFAPLAWEHNSLTAITCGPTSIWLSGFAPSGTRPTLFIQFGEGGSMKHFKPLFSQALAAALQVGAFLPPVAQDPDRHDALARSAIVATLVASLELARQGVVALDQTDADIRLEAAPVE